MKIACVQMRSTGDLQENLAKAKAYIAQAADAGAGLVVLPEFFNTIFFAQYQDRKYFALAESDTGPTVTAMREAAQRHRIDVIATLYEKAEAGLYFDTAMHIDRHGEIVFKYRKVHPAAVHSLEKLYFRYGTRFDTYAFDGWRVGIGICYDMGFPETARCLAVNGAELLIAPYATSRVHMFQEVLRTRAFENGCFLAAANKVGREGDWDMGGGSLIAGPDGKVLQSADTQSDALLVADLEHDQVEQARIAYPARRDRRPDLYSSLTREADAGR
jgi:N-carbamoylputrescine amidase